MKRSGHSREARSPGQTTDWEAKGWLRHHRKPLVGFYWTLPVPKADFRSLPADAAEAARVSRTIAYQRHVVRDFAARAMCPVVGEVTWMELRPDAGTPHVADAVRKAGALCRERGAALARVRFDDSLTQWRSHAPLCDALHVEGVEVLDFPPDPAFVVGGIFGERGQVFDPVAHFRRWREVMGQWATRAERRAEIRRQILIYAGKHLPPRREPGDFAAAARIANERGVRTLGGRPWTGDNLRMFLGLEVSRDTADRAVDVA